MRRTVLTVAICALCSCAFAQIENPAFTYVTEFETHPDYGPVLAIAADANGGIYFTQFSSPDPNMTACIYVEDPIGANGIENLIVVDDAAEDTDVPGGRGFHGLAVDEEGYIYLALEAGDNDTATVRRINPAPDFGLDESWGGGVIWPLKRYNGIELLGDNVMALSTFSEVDFWAQDDPNADLLHTVGGGETYQRDLAFNPSTGDIYISKNRDVSGAPFSSASILRGNGPDDLGSYEVIEADFIPQGGMGGQYGGHPQKIEYDALNDFIIIGDYSTDPPTMAFFRPTDTSQPAAAIDASDSPNGPFVYPTDAVAHADSDGDTFIYITTWTESRILVYQMGEFTGVWGWELH